MNKKLTTLLMLPLLAGSVYAGSAKATEMLPIIKKARCVACHSVDAKRVGPSYKDVAAKYRGDAGAPEHLFKKVREGGAGVWGDIPMVPHPEDKISDADLKEAIKWILALQ